MPVDRFPIVGSLTDRNVNATTSDTTDQRFENCFPEVIVNPLTQKTSIFLNKRHGAAASANVQSGAQGRQGSVVWTSNASAGAADAPVVLSFVKSGNAAIIFFNAETLAQIGADVATSGTANCLYMSQSNVGGVANLTASIVDGSSPETWFFPAGGSWTQVTDGDFPSDVTPLHAHMDGFMFVMTETGRIYNSDLNSLSAWTANNYITADSFADKGVGVVRYGKYLLGFGDVSGEFFYNAGNQSGSVLARIPELTFQVGAVRNGVTGVPAIKAIGDNVYWIGQNAASGARGVYRLKGTQPQKISTPAIDKLVSNGQITNTLGGFSMLGMTHIVFGTAGFLSWCYCVDTGYWWVLKFGGSSAIAGVGFIGAVNFEKVSKSYFTNSIDAKVWSFSPTSPVWQDNALSYTATVQTQNMDSGTRRRKFFSGITLIGDKQASTSNVGVSFSDNDYGAFSTARNIDMSATQPARLARLGASRRRSWQLTHSANTPMRLEAMEIEYEVGQN